MALFEEEARKPTPAHIVGQDVSLLSAGELALRIAMLKSEIERLEIERARRGETKSAAEALFRR